MASSLLKKGATAGLPSSAWEKPSERHCWPSQQWHPSEFSPPLVGGLFSSGVGGRPESCLQIRTYGEYNRAERGFRAGGAMER